MKNKILKILGVVATVAMLASFAVAPASAAIGTNAWGKVTLPTTNPISAVDQMEIANDGTLYASVVTSPTPGGTEYWTLYKSTDGIDWEATKLDSDKIGSDVRITAIAAAPDSKMIYVATWDIDTGETLVWKCPNGAEAEPYPIQALIDRSGVTAASYVYDLEVWSDGVTNWVMAACEMDTSPTTGEVLVLADGLFENWRDMDISTSFPDCSAVYRAKFAPDFNTSFVIWALINNSNEFVLTATGANSPGQWGTVIQDADFSGYAAMTGSPDPRVDFTFATDYDSDSPVLYAALADSTGGLTGNGNLFLVYFALVEDLPGEVTEWVALLDDRAMCSVGIAPDFIIAGALRNNVVLISTNGGDTFEEATKPPTGSGEVKIYLPKGYDPETGTAYAITRGFAYDESALSRSLDGGDTWNQIAFIDTTIDEILDMTWSPTFPAGGSFMLVLTYSDETDCLSLWRSGNATTIAEEGPFWERVLCANDSTGMYGFGNFFLDEDDQTLIEWSKDGSTVMLFGEDDEDPAIFRSSNNAQTFSKWRTLPADVGGNPSDDMVINDWVVLDSVTFYAATNMGFYSRKAFGPPTWVDTLGYLQSIALQPGFAPNDSAKDTLVVGADGATIFVSNDGGATFGAGQSVASVGSGDVYVAFDQLSASTIYFATSGSAVGTATIDGNKFATGSVKQFKDSAGNAAAADSFSGIWVSPGDLDAGGNVLYALGGDEIVTGSYYTYSLWGKVTMDNGTPASDDVALGFATVVNYGSIDISFNATNTESALPLDDLLLVPTDGEFDPAENLTIDDWDAVVVTDSNIISGRLYVSGDSSHATGYVDFVFVDSELPSDDHTGDTVANINENDAMVVALFDSSPVAVIQGSEIEVEDGAFGAGDTPEVTSHYVMVDYLFPTSVYGYIAIQNPVLDKGAAWVSWDADFGFANEDRGLLLDDFTDSTLQVQEVEHEYETGDDNVYLFRILIGEADNIWETAQIDGAYGLWGTKGSNILWTVVGEDELWALKDTMATSVKGVAISDIKETSAKVSWTELAGAKQYQVKYDTAAITDDSAVFKLVPLTATATPPTSTTISSLANNTKYNVWVRVPAGAPFQSRWSALKDFTTLETVGTPAILSPVNGQLNSPLNQTLNWTPVSGAKSYDIEVATSNDFSSPVVTANTTTTIYHLSNLAYDTDYAWRVRAVGATGAKGAWVISTFHTVAEAITPTTTIPTYTMTVSLPQQTQTTVVITQPPATSVVIPPATTFTQTVTSQTVTAVVQLPTAAAPAYVWAIVAIGALLTLAVIILIIRTRRVV